MIDHGSPNISDSPQSCDPSLPGDAPTPPHSIATTNAASFSPRPNSLDTQETSVGSDFAAFMASRPTDWKGQLDLVIGPPTRAEKFRHSGWWQIREKIRASLIRTNQSDSRILGFCTCGRNAWLQRANDDVTRFRVVQNNCHDRLCTPCANVRSWRIQQALMAMMAGKPATFITLTLCGKGESLTDLVDRIYKHFRALRAHPLWADKVDGGAAFLEIKWSDKAQRWHPHLHIICEAGFIPQGELSAVWHGISRDSFIVDIRRVKNADVCGHYVTKYASKPLNTSFMNSPKLLDDAVVALKGRRLCLCFGTWYGTPLSAAEDEELADDLIDAGGYTNYFALEDALELASSGDPYWIQVLLAAGVEARWRASLTAKYDSS